MTNHVATPLFMEEFIEGMGRKTCFGFINSLLIMYLLFVTWIGPNLMKKRPPYPLRKLVLSYNLTMVLANTFLVYKFYTTAEMDFASLCYLGLTNHQSFAYVLYGVTKIFELIETVLFVLRKKQSQVSGLHVFHHTIVVFLTMGTYLFYSPFQLFLPLCFLNSLVHVIMYTYYFLAALGPPIQKYLWWKKYLTQIQLIQFLIYMAVWAWLTNQDCNIDSKLRDAYFWSVIVFTVLFLKFYVKTYLNRNSRKQHKLKQ